MRLMREVRFSVTPDPPAAVTNSWAGWPTATSIAPYLILRARVEGEPDPITGYLCNIATIDRLIRDRAIPAARSLITAGTLRPEVLLPAMAGGLRDHAPPGARWVDWQLGVTPYLWYGLSEEEPAMIELRESFEFSASHRLHCPILSEEENRRIFGKCNNPNGHGHNYLLEVVIRGEPDPRTGMLIEVGAFEGIVDQQVIRALDHKHLNTDCPAFASLNPSVENIARVIWGMLHGRFGTARLHCIRVWETPKTCAEYYGPPE